MDHRAGGERLHDGASRRFNFDGGLAHVHPGNVFDLLPQRFGGVVEQLAVKLLHLAAPAAVLARARSAGDSAPCSVMTTVSPLSTTVTDVGELPVLCCSKAQAARATCFAIAEAGLSIEFLLVVAVATTTETKKSRRGGTPGGLPPRRLTR